MAKEVPCCEPQNGKTPKGVLVKFEAASASLFEECVCFASLLWRRCFGDSKQMRWVSWDQKPAWFNNTALDATYSTIGYEPLVKEIEAHSRQRFTVCTCVDSASTGDPDELPPVGVLFKAAPRRKVWQ